MSKFSWSDTPGQVAFPIAKPGYPFIFAAAFTTAILALIGFKVLAFLCLLITFFSCFFFRDPDRVVPKDDDAVISPADGEIVFAGEVNDSRYYEGDCMKISVFMTVFNVHVNRMPCAGTIKKVAYYPGKFLNASWDKASEENERNAIFLETPDGRKICTVQIAGLIARRIICRVQEGDTVKQGQRLGMICFGSRLDVYMPVDTQIKGSVGDKVSAGTSILGYF
ncbi:MAG: phosphatidylserine decarboxylase family protein [Desulfobacterales bacterium]|nr:phosphatidylserine decarboxylase family protein [Desulfobacterales bacterium]